MSVKKNRNLEENLACSSEKLSEYSLTEIGKLIREVRKREKLTQEQLAKKIGTKRSYISRIERNASNIRLSTLIRIIEEGLGCKLDISIRH